jgi:hypothetical protein
VASSQKRSNYYALLLGFFLALGLTAFGHQPTDSFAPVEMAYASDDGKTTPIDVAGDLVEELEITIRPTIGDSIQHYLSCVALSHVAEQHFSDSHPFLRPFSQGPPPKFLA